MKTQRSRGRFFFSGGQESVGAELLLENQLMNKDKVMKKSKMVMRD